MKKLAGLVAAFALVFVAQATIAPSAYAVTETSTANMAALVETLKTLMAKVAELQAQLSLVKGQISDALQDGLKEGVTSDDVKKIQSLLASDSEIYPAGKITGFFGPMTTEAIKRFQLKNEIEVTGVIDTETKAALETIIEQRKANGATPLGFMLRPEIKQKFEQKLRVRCDAVASSTSAAVPCTKIKEKYKFEVDDKGRIKMESESEVDSDDDSDDSDDSDDDSDDSDDDDDDDDDEDEDDDDDDDSGENNI